MVLGENGFTATDHELLEQLRGALAGRSDVRLAVLFGSRARGTAGVASDVDVGVLGDADVLTLAAELTRACGRDVHIAQLEDPPIPLLAAIVRDGVPLHEARPHAWAAYRASAWAILDTDLPWWRRMADAEMRRIANGTRWSTKTS